MKESIICGDWSKCDRHEPQRSGGKTNHLWNYKLNRALNDGLSHVYSERIKAGPQWLKAD